MKKVSLVILFFFSLLAAKAQNQYYISYQIPEELYNKQLLINAFQRDIYVFTGDVMIQKINKGQKSRVLVHDKSTLYSTGKITTQNIIEENKNYQATNLVHRNEYLTRIFSSKGVLSVWVFIVFFIVVLIKTLNRELFYGLVLPWIAYSNTEELMVKLSFYRLLLPTLLFSVLLIANIWLFSPEVTAGHLTYSVLLVAGVMIFKIILLFVLEFLVEGRQLARKHILEYLKMGIFFFLSLFTLKTIEILNLWNFEIAYKFLIFTYLIVWFGRLAYLIYQEVSRNIIYFFSYICISEIVPILLIWSFWGI
jgi:hypothetical protein